MNSNNQEIFEEEAIDVISAAIGFGVGMALALIIFLVSSQLNDLPCY